MIQYISFIFKPLWKLDFFFFWSCANQSLLSDIDCWNLPVISSHFTNKKMRPMEGNLFVQGQTVHSYRSAIRRRVSPLLPPHLFFSHKLLFPHTYREWCYFLARQPFSYKPVKNLFVSVVLGNPWICSIKEFLGLRNEIILGQPAFLTSP